MSIILIGAIMFLFPIGCAKDNHPNEVSPPLDHNSSKIPSVSDEPIDENITVMLIEQMSIDEKIGQLLFVGFTGTILTDEAKELIEQYKVGGIILFAHNLKNPSQTLELINDLKATNEKNHLPLFIGVDQEGGRVSRLPGELTKLPSNSKIAEVNDPLLSFEIGTVLGQQLNAFGFNLNFAPVLDVNSNPNNPVIGDRSFGSDPKIVSRLGIETMKGMQLQQVIPVIKHFPGHGDTEVDSHLELPLVHKSLEDLHKLELIPFRQAIDRGTDVVMIAHILLPQLDPTNPATLSHLVITGLLRNDLGYDGVVITDDMTMKSITNQYDIGTAAVESIKAGSDIIMVAHDYNSILFTIEALKKAVSNGELTEEQINESLARIIDLKLKYELTNERIESIDIENLNQKIAEVIEKIK